MQCEKKKKDGSRCRARALTDSCYCAIHAASGKAAELGRKGGRRRTVYTPDRLKMCPPPKSAADVVSLLAQAIVETREGKLEPRVANAIACLAGTLLRATELSKVEDRLNDLEKALTDAEQTIAHLTSPHDGTDR